MVPSSMENTIKAESTALVNCSGRMDRVMKVIFTTTRSKVMVRTDGVVVGPTLDSGCGSACTAEARSRGVMVPHYCVVGAISVGHSGKIWF